ncbi:Fic family protein [Nesterenkonia massiliensis]|uniref:Fic family protein n=1 Tax=Nesterenkonia massiliensis TaxID=1232429 RepID=A0ABT2HP28_9MICC|nr:Fic family protein [Nesterenkonia massiliensis]MCT1606442.1 Fic family protein [Nesterenkonia massiliensis]
MATLPVPAMGEEDHFWTAEPDGSTGRRRLAAATGPYRSAVPAELKDYRPALPPELVTDLDEATTALVRFDNYALGRLGRENNALGPMSSILLRTESSSSSQIENLTVGARQLALAELGQSSSDNASVVVGNLRAMEAALQLADRLDEDAILTMQRVLISAQRHGERYAGRYRDSLVWVGSSRVTPIGASHVAPQPELIRPAMQDLLTFMHRVDLPPLFQAAVAHAQFETIHPFVDGNGRTGRALVHAMLQTHGVMTATTAPVSAGLLRDTEGYFDALTAFRQGDAEPILSRFVEASLFASNSGMVLVDDLVTVLEDSEQKLTGLRRNASAWSVIPHLISHPVVDSRFLVTQVGLNEMTAQRALAQLTERGVLEERSGKRRHRVYQHPGVLQTLDAYAQQLHRR